MEDMFNICHLTTGHNLDDDRIFFKECVSLALNGYDVTIITCGNKEIEYTDKGVKLISIRIPIKNRFQRMIRYPKALYHKALQLDADIYHFHDPDLLGVGLKLKKKGKKVVYDAHEDVPRQILQKDWIPIFLRRPISLVFELVENFFVKHLDAVVTVTNHISNRFSRISKNVVVCANYASLKEFEVVTDWGVNRDKICYVGGISKLRGIEEVVYAAEKAGVSLELAGNFSSSSLEKKIIVKKNVNYRSYVNRNELSIIFSNCFAGMVTLHHAPNMTHSLPIKMFEYMASGIPVIASNFEDWKQIVETNNLGICVDPTNVESISSAILDLKNNPEKAQQMGLNGRKSFKERYNWEYEEKKLIALYNSL